MDNNKKHGNNNWILVLAGFISIIVALVVLVLFLIKGETNYSHSEGETTTETSLICEGSNVIYPFLPYDGKTNLLVKVFYDDDTLSSISLVYKEFLTSREDIAGQTNANNMKMSRIFIDDGLSFDSFDVDYTNLYDNTQMSIRAEKEDLNSQSAKYFMLENLSGHYSIEALSKNYNSYGLNCKISR